jgi:hypothetical protein
VQQSCPVEQPEGVSYLIPVRLEECEVPDRLSRWQWVDLYKHGSYERLVSRLGAQPSERQADPSYLGETAAEAARQYIQKLYER